MILWSFLFSWSHKDSEWSVRSCTWICFNRLLFTSFIKGGIPSLGFWADGHPILDRWHQWQFCWSHILPEYASQRYTELAFGSRVNKKGLWESGFLVLKGEGAHRRVWLACVANSAGWQGSDTCYSGVIRKYCDLPDKENFWARGPYSWDQIRKALLILPSVKTAHNVGLQFEGLHHSLFIKHKQMSHIRKVQERWCLAGKD